MFVTFVHGSQIIFGGKIFSPKYIFVETGIIFFWFFAEMGYPWNQVFGGKRPCSIKKYRFS